MLLKCLNIVMRWTEKWEEDEVKVRLGGGVDRGFVLVPFPKAGEDKWLLIGET